MPEESHFRGDVATVLRNVVCPYCYVQLKPKGFNIEHVIGRRFVPKNSMNQSWNLILNSCLACNAKKSDLENDISAITMQPDASGKFAHDSPLLLAEAQRRAKNAISRRTKRTVAESKESISVIRKFYTGTLSFNFISPPQIDQGRAFELAHMHLQGFFYMLTYDSNIGRGYPFKGGFHPLQYAIKSNWGNETQIAFAKTIADWDIRLIATPADEFFKVCIKKHPNAECWGWALEWNHNYRLVGFLGDVSTAQQIVNQYPPEKQTSMQTVNGKELIIQVDKAINPKDDILFQTVVVNEDQKLKVLLKNDQKNGS
ncbi:HNH endonuclease [Limnobacter sp.]|uniref:HNH endonuclease n=1 Tax=Limnobacter sp. TaxID=2003368 RepID=UPI003748559A